MVFLAGILAGSSLQKQLVDRYSNRSTCRVCIYWSTWCASSLNRSRPMDMPTKLMHSKALALIMLWLLSLALVRISRSKGMTYTAHLAFNPEVCTTLAFCKAQRMGTAESEVPL